MNTLFYIVTEGVHDVAFIGKLLSVVQRAKRIETLEELEEPLRVWVEKNFKWPKFTGKHHDIKRMSVPAPAFYRLSTGALVMLRNAQGLPEIVKTLEIDIEAFLRDSIQPDAMGVILDSDDEPAEKRFTKLKVKLGELNLVPPASLGEVSSEAPRVGVFVLPEPGIAGTLEDLLLKLGDAAYPELTGMARDYAARWRQRADDDLNSEAWKEIKKPAGQKKATIGAIVAILKPGRATQVSLEDNRWVSAETQALACLQPIIAFLNALLTVAAPTSAGGAPAEKQGSVA